MVERPILFSAPMVRAILSGQKTVTRLVVKANPDKDMGKRCVLQPHELAGEVNAGNFRNCRYGQPGDRLWVREAWADVNMCGAPALAYRADEDVRDLMAEDLFLDEDGAFNYQDPRWKKYAFGLWYADLHLARWRPSIHMPRWASRIQLEITAVRVERLQDISEDQAMAEGVSHESVKAFRRVGVTRAAGFAFRDLWGAINGAGTWDANPWVWVVEFKLAGVDDV